MQSLNLPFFIGAALASSVILGSVTAHADTSPWMELGPAINEIAKSDPVYTPVVVVHHSDGTREVLPLERVSPENDSPVHPENALPLSLLIEGSSDIVTADAGLGYTTLQGAYVSLGICLGPFGSIGYAGERGGVLLEIAPGTNGLKLKAGLNWDLIPVAGLSVSAAYIKMYGPDLIGADPMGGQTRVLQGADLIGVEGTLDLTVVHGILGAYKDLSSGSWVVNAGGGIRF